MVEGAVRLVGPLRQVRHRGRSRLLGGENFSRQSGIWEIVLAVSVLAVSSGASGSNCKDSLRASLSTWAKLQPRCCCWCRAGMHSRPAMLPTTSQLDAC